MKIDVVARLGVAIPTIKASSYFLSEVLLTWIGPATKAVGDRASSTAAAPLKRPGSLQKWAVAALKKPLQSFAYTV